MNTVLVILNGICRRKAHFLNHLLPALKKSFNVEVRETGFAGHAETLAAQAVDEGFSVILSAGGDGTMHQVLNGVLRTNRTDLPLLGIIPLGSGNDFARALGHDADASRLVARIRRGDETLIDVGLANIADINGNSRSRYYMNECSLGMGPEVVRRVEKGGRSAAARLMYLKAIVITFFTLKPEQIDVVSESVTWSGLSRAIAVANGKCFGHGIYIAPDADQQDGLLNVFLAANPGMVRFLLLLQQLKKPFKSTASCLQYFTTRKVHVTSRKALPVEADGELIGFTPLQCEVLHRRVRFLR